MQVAAADDGAEEKIAVWNVVDAVAEDVALERPGIDCLINCGRVCCGDDEEVPVEISEFEGDRDPAATARQFRGEDAGRTRGSHRR